MPRKFARLSIVASALLALAAAAAHATTYDVGANKPYKTLSSVPWASLAAGDTVNIHWQSQPYREMILISTSGTAAKPITVQGVADPVTGQFPTIDGANAVQSPALPYHDKTYAGQVLYTLGPVMVGPPLGNAYNYVPQYITIQNLIVRNGHPNNTFTDYTGKTNRYNSFASAIYVEGAQHLTIRGCTLYGSGNGLFINSKYGSTGVSKDILVESNSIYGNGIVGETHMHNVYTEAEGIVFQYNVIGDIVPGSYGNALKDRSAGTVIRYNWIGAGGHCIDLVEAQGGQGYLDLQPSYKKTYVYGNVLWNGVQGAVTLVHYGGDQWNYANYRRGMLYFYNNTVITQGNQRSQPAAAYDRWYTIMFQLPSVAETANQPVLETVDIRNNVIYNLPLTPGMAPSDFYMVASDGTATLNMGTNWLSPGTMQAYSGFKGSVNGWANGFFGNSQGVNDPGFVNFAGGDLNLKAGSRAIGSGGVLLQEEQGIYAPDRQYQAPLSGIGRLGSLVNLDLGAFGYGGVNSNPTYTLSGTVTSANVGLSGVTVSSGNQSVTTAADGSYSFTGLAAGTYTVSASKTGYTFDGPQTVALSANKTGVNFIGTVVPPPPATYTLSGKVTSASVGLGGVTLSAGTGLTATSAADGTYTFTGLAAGTYTVSASKTGYTFDGPQTVALSANKTGVNFVGTLVPVATYTLSGKVTSGSAGLSGVTVSTGSQSVTTAADGSYSFTGLAAGTYTVSASKTGYTFDGPQTVALSANKTGVNFIGTVATVAATQLASLTMNVSSVKAYDRPLATATLNRVVPNAEQYATIKLTSSNPAVVSVSDLKIWAPNSKKTIDLATYGVTKSTTVTITATCGGVTKTFVLTVVPR